jgi:hypothetical protein
MPDAGAAPIPVRANPFRPILAPRPAMAPEVEPAPLPPQPTQPPRAPAPSPAPSGRSIFNMMTRSIRRPASPEPTEPQRAEPSFMPDAAPATSQAQHNGDETLEIPAFLRRQNS